MKEKRRKREREREMELQTEEKIGIERKCVIVRDLRLSQRCC